MFNWLTDKDIAGALDELAATLGVKEDAPAEALFALLRKNDKQGTQECVQQIASWLGLPILVDLSYVSKNFKPGDSNRFQSEQLSRTGRGTGGITAQVTIPAQLPMYGTKSLQGYRIQVRVSENCCEQPATFIAVVAHELSHVLLHSLLHAQKDSELHTDLVPVLLGFEEIVGNGRKDVQLRAEGKSTTQRTTTYGYLTDSQFEFARDRVRNTLAGHSSRKNQVLVQAAQLRPKLTEARRRLAKFRNDLRYIDDHPNETGRAADSAKLVEYHKLDYTRKWESVIEQAEIVLGGIEGFALNLTHYTSTSVDQLVAEARRLSLTSQRLHELVGEIATDLGVLRKYVGPVRKLWISLRLR